MVIGKRPTQMGERYVELRNQGKSSRDACDIIRDEFQRPGMSDVTIRSYGVKVKRPELFPRPTREPLGTSRKVFTLVNPLVAQFEAEAKARKLNGSDLLTLILAQRYGGRKKIKG